MTEKAKVALASRMRSENRPRFTVQDDGKWIDDDDFIFDAIIQIRGDFKDEERLAFAQWVADALNQADASLPKDGRA